MKNNFKVMRAIALALVLSMIPVFAASCDVKVTCESHDYTDYGEWEISALTHSREVYCECGESKTLRAGHVFDPIKGTCIACGVNRRDCASLPKN